MSTAAKHRAGARGLPGRRPVQSLRRACLRGSASCAPRQSAAGPCDPRLDGAGCGPAVLAPALVLRLGHGAARSLARGTLPSSGRPRGRGGHGQVIRREALERHPRRQPPTSSCPGRRRVGQSRRGRGPAARPGGPRRWSRPAPRRARRATARSRALPRSPSTPPSRIRAAMSRASSTLAGAASSTLNAISGGRAATSTAPAVA